MEKALAGMPQAASETRIRTVGVIVDEYERFYGQNHRPKSVIFSKQRLVHVRRLLKGFMLIDLTETVIREYIQTRMDEGVSGRTINMELGELSRAIGRTWRELWPKVRKLEERQDVGRALSPEEESRLLDAAAMDDSPNRNPMLYTFLKIALTTGMRAGEICSLRWSQVDFRNGILTVGVAKSEAGTGRTIPMNGDLRAALETHLSWYSAKMRKLGHLEVLPDWFLFPGKAGRPKKGAPRPLDPTIQIGSVSTAWEKLRIKAGVSCRQHDLRHTAATKMAEAGVSEAAMKAILGHMSSKMLELYSHIRMAAKREAVEAMSLPVVGANKKPISTISTTVERGGTIQ
jgi:integrase